jgi:hypothetical protein
MNTAPKGTCPVCNGTKRVAVTPEQERYCKIYAGYDKETHTLGCGNCGGQYMFGKATGEVSLRPDGTPCTHKYTSETVGRCYHRYACIECGDAYHIDSGD